jgi:DNA-binding NtrC family response regulator
VFGRGKARDADSQPRLELVRDRPGHAERTEPLASPKLSREQLLLRCHGEDSIEVKNVGQAKVVRGDDEVTNVRLAAGDMLEVGSQLLFLCVRRPAWTPAVGKNRSLHPFGQPDEHGIVGESPAIWDVRDQIAFAAPLAGHVLVTGASGSGKELVARAIHTGSRRGKRPMVSRNASTIPETLVDAELFGNMKGYPNPGTPERPGLVGQADGSSLLLDEISELPEASQAHLLRLLDSGEYQRLGDARVRHADVRVIAATNRPGALRHDLTPRLALRIDLPDLNARREDIPLVARWLAARFAADHPDTWRSVRDDERAGDVRFSSDFVRAIIAHDYKTNVRELEALIWQAVRHSHGTELECPPSVSDRASGSVAPREDRVSSPAAVRPEELEPTQIQACLDAHRGSIEHTWRALGLTSRFVLLRLIKKHGLRTR